MPHASPDCQVCKSAVSLRMPTLYVLQVCECDAAGTLLQKVCG